MIKEEAGPQRPGQAAGLPLFTPHLSHPRAGRGGGVGGVYGSCGVTGDDRLPWGEERGGSSAPNPQDLMKGDLFILFF